MIYLKSAGEIKKIRKAGIIVAQCYKEIGNFIRPGISTLKIDKLVEEIVSKHGAKLAQKGYSGYPYATCASVNDGVCHCFPNNNPLVDGDIVTIDMVVELDGWMADSAWSFEVGAVSEDAKKLLEVTKKSLYLGIEQAQIGNRIGDISFAIQQYAESNGFSVVKDFVGHGIGKSMHEEPQVPHYGNPKRGQRIIEGMVFTIEPMINAGDYRIKIDDNNNWDARTLDGSLSAQYEHTIAITKDGPLILTCLDE